MTELSLLERDGVRVPEGASTPSHFPSDTLAALEFPAVLDLVAGHARGPLGAERVRSLRPLRERAAVADELEMVAELLRLADRGEAVDVPPVPEVAGVLRRLRVDGSVLNGSELLAIRQTLAAGRVTHGEISRVAADAPRTAARLAPLPDRAIERRLDAALDDDGEVRDSASPRLQRARRAVHEARDRLVRKLEDVLRGLDAQAVPSGAQVTVRDDRYVIPVRRDSRSRPAGIVHDESASHATLFVEPTDAIEFGNALRSAIADAEREALAVLRELTERCRPERERIEAVHAMCVVGDALLARVRYARAVSGAVPALTDGALTLRAARHPILLARGLDVVPFDLALEPDERTLLISGPNAGGKTVLLKTAGLAVALAQAGVVPPIGPGSELPVFDGMVADIGDHQSIAADLSTFSAHVATLRTLLAEAGPRTLVLMDEIGSGTDPAEGAALAAATLTALTRRGALTIVTTHLGALKTLASDVPGVINGSLEFDAAELRPTFRFVKGVPGRSYGLAIARRLGVDAEVLAAAEALVPDGERSLDELLSQVEARARLLERRERELDGVRADLERRETVAARTEAEHAARDRELKRLERDADRDARAAARKHLLDARSRVEEAIRLAQADADAATQARRLVEDAAREEAEALERLDAEAAEPLDAPALRVGQRVRLASGASGSVLERRADGKVLVAVGSVKLVVSAGELTAARGGEEVPPPVPRGDAPELPDAPEEIDLRGLTGDDAHVATVAALDAAVVADRPVLRIIHGMGTGVVRERVHRVLKADRRVARFAFAPRQAGGTGVTIAELRS